MPYSFVCLQCLLQRERSKLFTHIPKFRETDCVDRTLRVGGMQQLPADGNLVEMTWMLSKSWTSACRFNIAKGCGTISTRTPKAISQRPRRTGRNWSRKMGNLVAGSVRRVFPWHLDGRCRALCTCTLRRTRMVRAFVTLPRFLLITGVASCVWTLGILFLAPAFRRATGRSAASWRGIKTRRGG